LNANQIAIATTATAIFRKLLIREELGSTATIHKRIHQLKDAGFVSFDTLTSSETKTLSPNKTPQHPMMP
jgi:hypothetical protein